MNQLRWSVPDTIPSGKSVMLVYQLSIGADALESEGMNTAYASASAGSTTLVSVPSQWQVTVRPGVFTEKGLIIGKVFYDDNRNTFQDEGENGEKGIELWMEDGTKIVTGNDGKFSLPEVKPGQHVLRVNEMTLPKSIGLMAGNNAFANDAVSRFVRVTEGGIAKANFYLKRSVSDSILQTLAKVNKLVAVRQAVPKYLFVDTIRSVRLDTVLFSVAYSYSGNRGVQSMVITDKLDERMTVVPNSATHNGKRINPFLGVNGIEWRLGTAPAMSRGVIKYKAVVQEMPVERSRLTSFSMLSAISVDSIIVESGRIYTDNFVVDTLRNSIETSDIGSASSDPRISNHLSDSVNVSEGDNVFFKTVIYIDPKKVVKEAQFVDSLPSVFIVNDRTFTVNGVPVPSKNLSVRIRSMALSSVRRKLEDTELEFIRISTLDMTELLRQGKNEITYSAQLKDVKKDTVYRKHSYAVITDSYGEVSTLHSKDARIFASAGMNAEVLMLETTYVDIPRPAVNVVEKVADAVKLVESLRQGSASPVVMDGITFELAKATLTQDSKVVLDNIASLLLANPDISIQINGYTDNTGNAASNRKMSLNRAKEVAVYLSSKGIDPKRLLPQGFGPAKPIATNKTEEGRSKNRRVEFAPL
jgi:uncharacterized repeat protein (TIGR01451 family)